MQKFDLFQKEGDKIFTITKIFELEDEYLIENQLLHLHNFYSIFWITEGQAVHATNFVEYVIEKDTILFVPPGLKHRLVLNKLVRGYCIFFNEEFVRHNQKNYTPLKEYELFNNPQFKSMIRVEDDTKNKISGIFNMMLSEVQQADSYSQDVILNLLHLFLLESRRVFDIQYQPLNQSEEDSTIATIIKFKKLIEDNYIAEKSVSAYAEMLDMNPSCLNELAKKSTGITAGEMIRNRVIEETKQKLFTTDRSGKEISYDLGFEDPAYFSRFFKKYTGYTLKTFREISRKKYH